MGQAYIPTMTPNDGKDYVGKDLKIEMNFPLTGLH
jgi:hypothetical protein